MALVIEKQEHIWLIKINRPEQLNALNKEVIESLSHSLEDFKSDPKARVLLLSGAGEKAFVAGADIKEFVSFNAKQGKALSAEGHQKLFNKIAELGKPVIAMINGYALGGGLELAMACTFRIASEHAQMGLPELKLGLIPGYGGTQRLVELIGKGKALELMLTADMIDAPTAKVFGLVNHVVHKDQLEDLGLQLAKRIARNSPQAIRSLLNLNHQTSFNALDFEAEVDAFGSLFGTDDFKEGTAAFIEKRKAQF